MNQHIAATCNDIAVTWIDRSRPIDNHTFDLLFALYYDWSITCGRDGMSPEEILALPLSAVQRRCFLDHTEHTMAAQAARHESVAHERQLQISQYAVQGDS